MMKIRDLFLFGIIILNGLFLSGQVPVTNIKTFGKNTDTIYVADGHSHMGLKRVDEKLEFSDIHYLKSRYIKSVIFCLPANRGFKGNIYNELPGDFTKIDCLFKKQDYVHQGIRFQFCIEYFHGLGGFTDSTFIFLAEKGIKYITFIDHDSFKLFDDDKLSKKGIVLIEQLNKAGISIDISHINEKQMQAVIQQSELPVIASHSGVRNVTNESYNLSDSVIKSITEKGGLIMITFNKNGLIKKDSNARGVNVFCEHINYVVQLSGKEHVAIGTDLQANGKYIPDDMKAENVNNLVKRKLNQLGYSQAEIEQIFYKNLEVFFNH